MNGERAQELIYRGFGIAASKIGLPYDQYRPTAAITPIPLDPSNKIATIDAHFRVDDKVTKFQAHGKPLWRGWFDGRVTQVFDYLVGPEGTFFIGAQQALLPIMAVWCNATVNIAMATAPAGVGAQPYQGTTQTNTTPLMTGWPASVLSHSKRSIGDVNLPGDVPNPWWQILMPSFGGIEIETAYIITDDQGRRFVISSAELSPLGWRIVAQQMLT
jgi:hypothetical protein